MFNGAGRTANTADDNLPKSFARFFVDNIFPALTTYSETFSKSALFSPKAVTLSSPLILLSSRRTLFSVLTEELIYKNL